MDIHISIIVPVFNSESYLTRALDSCVNQTMKEIEIICIDDMSTDGSLSILKKYEKQYPQKVIVKSLSKKGGQGGARNMGIALSRGDYICFLDSDDYLDIHLCEDVYDKIVNDKPDMIYYDYIRVTNGTEFQVQLISKEDVPYWYHNDGCAVWLQMIRKKIITDNNIYLPNNIRADDDAVTPLWKYYAKKKIKMDKPYYFYTFRNDSLANDVSCEKVISPIKNVVPYRNSEFIKHNLQSTLKAEIDCLMARDINNTLRRLFKIGIDYNSLDMIDLCNSMSLDEKYVLDEKLINQSLTEGQKEYVKLFISNPYYFVENNISYLDYLDNVYNKGLTRLENTIIMDWINNNNNGYTYVIWGANELGIAMYSTLIKENVNVVLADNNKKYVRLINMSLKVYNVNELKKMQIACIFITTLGFYSEIKMQLREMGYYNKDVNAIDLFRHYIAEK